MNAAFTTGFWRTVALLVGSARRRARSRARHNASVLAKRGGYDWSAIAGALLVLLATGQQLGAVMLVYEGVSLTQRIAIEAKGRMLVGQECMDRLAPVRESVQSARFRERYGTSELTDSALRSALSGQGNRFDELHADAYEERLFAQYRKLGAAGLAVLPDVSGFALSGERLGAPLSVLLSCVVLAWFALLAFLGEGSELDFQRRRHPMWEWLWTHPVDLRAVFFAEMLTPLAGNVALWVAPLFGAGVFAVAYDFSLYHVCAGLLAGAALAIAAGCVGKTVEIVVLLRLAPSARGAALGTLAWLGQSMSGIMLIGVLAPSLLLKLVQAIAHVDIHVPVFEWLLGMGERPNSWLGAARCVLVAAVLITCSVVSSAAATSRGLAGQFGDLPDGQRTLRHRAESRWLGNPVYRKELLWLWRDRGAIVQVFLVPITIAAFQLLNLRRFVMHAGEAWQLMAGSIALFGSYFLFALGPRSLVSEGAALWLPLTWPHGLDALLKAKARLWWLASLALVLPMLLLTAARFPSHAWQLVLVAIAWGIFGHGLAQRSVTLVTVPSSSGEVTGPSWGARWGAMLGTLSFGFGLLAQQWSLAIVGVVYGTLTTAAIWQAFRARLPYLLDPWSERRPAPPTLVHAMVAIATMVEVLSALLALVRFWTDSEARPAAAAVAYGVCSLGAASIVGFWLAERGVTFRQIVRFGAERVRATRLLTAVAVAIALGVGLGFGGRLYVRVLVDWFPSGPALREALPGNLIWTALISVGFAPLAEEYLFRGLLYRALEREWAGAQAIAGSACFFAIYHPWQAWLPVGLLGVACAWLFKRGGHLAPCVVLHATYNAVVMGMTPL